MMIRVSYKFPTHRKKRLFFTHVLFLISQFFSREKKEKEEEERLVHPFWRKGKLISTKSLIYGYERERERERKRTWTDSEVRGGDILERWNVLTVDNFAIFFFRRGRRIRRSCRRSWWWRIFRLFNVGRRRARDLVPRASSRLLLLLARQRTRRRRRRVELLG